jgi:MtN3 and saliva related transmembrane protein
LTDGLATLAAVFGVLIGLGPLLQLSRMLQRRTARDVSVAYFCLLVTGNLVWLAYGWSIANGPLVAANFISLGTSSSTIVLALVFSRSNTQS